VMIKEINHLTFITADESRWIRSPSSAFFIHEKLGVKQVVLNALIKLTFILYFYSRQGPRGRSPRDYLQESKQPISPTLAAGDRTVVPI